VGWTGERVEISHWLSGCVHVGLLLHLTGYCYHILVFLTTSFGLGCYLFVLGFQYSISLYWVELLVVVSRDSWTSHLFFVCLLGEIV
jgi:hypothetical protein